MYSYINIYYVRTSYEIQKQLGYKNDLRLITSGCLSAVAKGLHNTYQPLMVEF